MELGINMLLLPYEIITCFVFQISLLYTLHTPYTEIYTFIYGKTGLKEIFGVGFKGKNLAESF